MWPNYSWLVSCRLVAAMFMTYIAIHAWLKPGVAPVERGAQSMKELVDAALDVVPFVILIGPRSEASIPVRDFKWKPQPWAAFCNDHRGVLG